jgi:hypothetical protein
MLLIAGSVDSQSVSDPEAGERAARAIRRGPHQRVGGLDAISGT